MHNSSHVLGEEYIDTEQTGISQGLVYMIESSLTAGGYKLLIFRRHQTASTQGESRKGYLKSRYVLVDAGMFAGKYTLKTFQGVRTITPAVMR